MKPVYLKLGLSSQIFMFLFVFCTPKNSSSAIFTKIGGMSFSEVYPKIFLHVLNIYKCCETIGFKT